MATFRALNSASRGRGRGRDASRAAIFSHAGEDSSGNVAPGSSLAADTEKLYFDSYANLGIHQEMIQVYAIDASDIAIHAQQVVQANGLADVITVLHKRVE
ncbi:unnamed protein product, partial [Closterium sp. Naga37s-1]